VLVHSIPRGPISRTPLTGCLNGVVSAHACKRWKWLIGPYHKYDSFQCKMLSGSFGGLIVKFSWQLQTEQLIRNKVPWCLCKIRSITLYNVACVLHIITPHFTKSPRLCSFIPHFPTGIVTVLYSLGPYLFFIFGRRKNIWPSQIDWQVLQADRRDAENLPRSDMCVNPAHGPVHSRRSTQSDGT